MRDVIGSCHGRVYEWRKYNGIGAAARAGVWIGVSMGPKTTRGGIVSVLFAF